jgi:hypothetical protein
LRLPRRRAKPKHLEFKASGTGKIEPVLQSRNSNRSARGLEGFFVRLINQAIKRARRMLGQEMHDAGRLKAGRDVVRLWTLCCILLCAIGFWSLIGFLLIGHK